MQQVVVAVVEREEEAARQEEVAEEHGDFVLPERVDREQPTAALGFVYDIVVHERGGVQELDERGGAVALFGDTAAELGREEHERRAYLLALLPEDVLRDLVQQPHTRPHRIAKMTTERREIVLHGRTDLCHRRRGAVEK